MSAAHTVTGLAVLAAVVQAAFSALPHPDFMDVNRLEYIGGNVVFERTIHEPGVIADWSVFVTDGSRTVCAGVGSSEYTPEETRQKNMPLSAFVGEPCNLPTGKYTLYAYWHPRDDRRQVQATTTFEVTE